MFIDKTFFSKNKSRSSRALLDITIWGRRSELYMNGTQEYGKQMGSLIKEDKKEGAGNEIQIEFLF